MLTRETWVSRETTRRWMLIGAAEALVAAASASVAVALVGDRAPAPPRTSSPAPHIRPVAQPAKCATWHCTRAQSVDLGGGYRISLWHAGKPGDWSAEPVVELRRAGVSVQWWAWRQ